MLRVLIKQHSVHMLMIAEQIMFSRMRCKLLVHGFLGSLNVHVAACAALTNVEADLHDFQLRLVSTEPASESCSFFSPFVLLSLRRDTRVHSIRSLRQCCC